MSKPEVASLSSHSHPALSAGWTWATLGDIAQFVRNGTSVAPREETGVPILRISAVRPLSLDTSDLRYLPGSLKDFAEFEIEPGDLLFTRYNGNPALVGSCAVVPSGLKGVVHPDKLIRVRIRSCSPDFVCAATATHYSREHIRRSTRSTAGQAGISGADLKLTPIPVAPLSEQHGIVEALDSYLTRLDAATEGLKRVEANLKRYRASVLKAAVEGHLVPTEAELAKKEKREYEPASVLLERILKERRHRWEQAELAKMKAKGEVPKNDKWTEKYQEPTGPDTSELPELPEGWCWAALPQLGELNRGKSKHRPRDDERLYGGPYPFIQTGDVRRADGFISQYDQTYSDFGLQQSRLWPRGTLCITIAANIAETGILTFDSCFPDSVVGFLSYGEGPLVQFIEYFFRTAKEGLERYAPATAQKNINLDTLSNLAVPLPPLREQERLVPELERFLSVSSHAAMDTERGILEITRLRQSILRWAFEGKLVDQDPSDEPASLLLERIRRERESSQPVKTPKSERGRRKTA